MITSLLRGINDAGVSRRIIDRNYPNTLPEALQGLVQIAERDDRYTRLNRKEEVMDVASICTANDDFMRELVSTLDSHNDNQKHMNFSDPGQTTADQTLTPENMAEIVAAVRQQMGILNQSGPTNQHELNRPQHNNSQFRDQNNGAQKQPRMPKFDPQGSPRCFQCNQYGHYASQCPQVPGN